MIEESITPDDAELSAYLDGELPQDRADRLTERLAAEPMLLRRLAAMRSADHATRRLFARLDGLPMPKGVLDLLQQKGTASSDNNVVSFPVRALRQYLQLPVAIAASVALLAGFLVHDLLRSNAANGGDPAVLVAGDIVAGSALHGMLETGSGSAPHTLASGTQAQVLLTFEERNGDYCRHLQLASESRSAQALACRRAGGWQLEVLDFAPGAPPGGPYQQASQQSSAAVNAAVEALIGGNEPLDAEAESRLVESGWKKITD
jgi:hypothetical protein